MRLSYFDTAVADPGLQISGVGGGGHLDPEKRRGRSLKKNFPPFGPQFGPKIRGTRPHPLDSHCTGHLGPALNGLCYGCQTSTPPSLPITFLNGRDTRGR